MRRLGTTLVQHLLQYLGIKPGARRIPVLGNVVIIEQNTTYQDQNGPDGKPWDATPGPYIDQYDNILELASKWPENDMFWGYSNDEGQTWTDITSSPGDSVYPVPVVRAALIKAPQHLYAFYAGDAPDGVILRRYTAGYTGDAISGVSKADSMNLQLDYQFGSNSMDYQHPTLMYIPGIGANGAIVCIWHAVNRLGGSVGVEIRAAMRVLTNDANDNLAANWTHIGFASVSTIGNSPTDSASRGSSGGNGALASYSTLYSSATEGANGWPSALYVTSGAHAGDIYLAYIRDAASVQSVMMRRLVWNSGSSRWTSMSTPVPLGTLGHGGVYGGYTLKHQLLTKLEHDTRTGRVWVGWSTHWDGTTYGDSWVINYLDASDIAGSVIPVYRSTVATNHANIFVTGSIKWDSATGFLVVAYTDLPNKHAWVLSYDNGVQQQDPAQIVDVFDIPVLVDTRFGSENKVLIIYRDFNSPGATQNPPTYSGGPYKGKLATLKWS